MVKAVIFDFFGVLVSTGLDNFYEDYCQNIDKREEAKRLVRDFNTGLVAMSHKDVVSQLAQLANITVEEVRKYMDHNKPNKRLLAYIRKELKPRYKLAILSNSGSDYVRHFLTPADVELFDQIILSFEHGTTKPDPKIFKIALEEIGVSASESIFVDDTELHCRAAEKLGMQAVVFKSFDQFKNDFEELVAVSDN